MAPFHGGILTMKWLIFNCARALAEAKPKALKMFLFFPCAPTGNCGVIIFSDACA
jgi:hypothetical protein